MTALRVAWLSALVALALYGCLCAGYVLDHGAEPWPFRLGVSLALLCGSVALLRRAVVRDGSTSVARKRSGRAVVQLAEHRRYPIVLRPPEVGSSNLSRPVARALPDRREVDRLARRKP